MIQQYVYYTAGSVQYDVMRYDIMILEIRDITVVLLYCYQVQYSAMCYG